MLATEDELAKVDAKKNAEAHKLEKEVFAEEVNPPPATWTFDFNDRDHPILEEMKQYEREFEFAKLSWTSLDPIEFWVSRAGQYPCLFELACKSLAVPATSVLSEQVFSTAGRVSTRDRSMLEARTVEMLVLLQRSAIREDVEAL